MAGRCRKCPFYDLRITLLKTIFVSFNNIHKTDDKLLATDSPLDHSEVNMESTLAQRWQTGRELQDSVIVVGKPGKVHLQCDTHNLGVPVQKWNFIESHNSYGNWIY